MASYQATTKPDSCASNTAGSLSGGSVAYTVSYGYDTLGRLAYGPLGPYTYGDSSHRHAVTSIGTGGGASPRRSTDAHRLPR